LLEEFRLKKGREKIIVLLLSLITYAISHWVWDKASPPSTHKPERSWIFLILVSWAYGFDIQ
jgi:hypothetical protein